MSVSSLFRGETPQYSFSAAAGSEGNVFVKDGQNGVALASPGGLELGQSLSFSLTFTETGGSASYTVDCEAVYWNVPGGKYVVINIGEGSAAFSVGGTELQSSTFPATPTPSADTTAGLVNVVQGTTYRPACITARTNSTVLFRTSGGAIAASSGTVTACTVSYYVHSS